MDVQAHQGHHCLHISLAALFCLTQLISDDKTKYLDSQKIESLKIKNLHVVVYELYSIKTFASPHMLISVCDLVVGNMSFMTRT